uniref:Palmitoyltransferase n=1 Tax=Sinocyclocheilus rhinocerous TaxID=307959 RepID=A0A673HLL6_9TELE
MLTLKLVRNNLCCNILQCHSHGHMGDSCHGHGGGHSHGHGGPGFSGFMPGGFHGQLVPGPLDPTQQPRKVSHPEDSSSWDIVKATQFGALERCKELIEAGYDVRQPDKENVTPLHWAAINNRADIVKYYISKGAVIDQLGGDLNSTPLHWAVRQGHLSMVIQLMRYGADPSLADGEGYRGLHLAVLFQHMPIAAFLMAKGQEVDSPDINGQTPLMLAAQKIIGPEPTNFLIKCNASVNAVDKVNRNSPLHCAVLAGNVDAVHILLEAGASIDLENANVSGHISPLSAPIMALSLSYNMHLFLPYLLNDSQMIRSTINFFQTPPLRDLYVLGVCRDLNMRCSHDPSATVQMLFTFNITALLYYYLRSCRTDPGIVKATEEEKKKSLKTLFLQMRKPMRANHCFSCNACVAKQDHHSIWINGCIGARNHPYFVLFLVALNFLCIWMFYGSIMYWSQHCPPHYTEEGVWGVVTTLTGCSPWVLYIFCFAFLNASWASILLLVQLYQIAFLGLTTAERANLMHRQRKLPQAFSLRQNPFNLGVVRNLVNFFQWRCCGLCKPMVLDWTQQYPMGLSRDHPMFSGPDAV